MVLVEKRSWCGNTCSRMNATVRAICCRLEICNLFAVSAANQQALKARIRGRGERIPHQDFAATELRGNFWLPGKILLSKDHVFCFALSSHWSLLKMSFLRFWPGIRLVTKWIYRKQKVVIKWIQLYPAYNHLHELKIPSPFLNIPPVKFPKHRGDASRKASLID